MRRDLAVAVTVSLVLHTLVLGSIELALFSGPARTQPASSGPLRVALSPGAARRPAPPQPAAAQESSPPSPAAAPAAAPAAEVPAAAEAPALDGRDNARPAEARPADARPARTPPTEGQQSDGSSAPAEASVGSPGPGTTEPPSHRPPRLAAPVEPAYPFRSRRLGHEGAVTFTVLVGPDGSVVDVALERGSGYPRLDESARTAVLAASYRPGSAEEPMPLRVRVVFRLETPPRGQ